MQLGAGIEVHHLRVCFIFINHVRALHSLVHHLRDFEHLLNGVALRFVQLLGVERDAGLRLEKLADLANEDDAVLLIFNVV